MATVIKPNTEPLEDRAIAPVKGASTGTSLRVVLLLLSVLFCGMLGSNYWYQSRVHQQLNYYPYHWKINWLTSPYTDRNLACFRKTIYVDGNVDHAYLAVAGDNFFKLTVNHSPATMFFHPGSTRGFQPGTEPSPYTELGIRRHSQAGAIFNIGKQLRPGPNVICIIAETDEDKEPRIAVQGEVTSGSTQEIVSDGTWKCAPQEESQAGVAWNELPFRDVSWKNAAMTSDPVTSYVDGDPSVLTDPLGGYYITTTQRNKKAPIFLKTTVDCPEGDNQGYLRLGWTSTYDLVINGRLVSSTSMADRYGVGIVKSSASDFAVRAIQSGGGANSTATKNQAGTDTYVFQNLFHPGRNTIEVTLHGLEVPMYWTIPQLYMDGKVQSTNGQVVRFQTDSNWQAQSAIDGPSTTPTILRQPAQLNTNAIIGKGNARALSSDMAMYHDLAVVDAWLFVILLVVCLLIGFCQPGVKPAVAFTRGAACVVLPVAFMTTAMIVQWIFAWSPQNRYFATREFGSMVLTVAFVLLIVNAAAVLVASMVSRPAAQPPIMGGQERTLAGFVDRFGFAIALGLIMFAAGVLYFRGLGNEAYIPDEYVSMLAATGILHRGIPIYENSGILYPRSSLYHYILAAFLAIAKSQHNLVYTRVPSVLWQLALIPLAYLYGRELRSKYVGLAAAAVIAFSPYLEYFAREVRFYSQFSFFATLIFYLLLKSVRNPEQQKYRVGTILAFAAAYLSQQIILGTIPAILVVLLFARQLRTWFEWKTVRWLLLAATVIAADLGAYFIWCVTPLPFIDGMAEPLLGLHADYLDTLPSLLMAYVEREQLVVGMLFVGGFIGAVWLMASRRHEGGQAWPWWKFQYLAVTAATAVTVLILPHPEPRYVCELFPVIAITSVCVAAAIIARVGDWMTNDARMPVLSRPMQVAVTVAFAALLTAEARPVRSYNTTNRHVNRDVTGACDYIRTHMQPGDKLMFFTPEVAMIEFGRCEYSWRPSGASLDKYISADGRLRERNSAAVVIDSPDKLRKVMTRDKRVWLVVSPISAVFAGNTGKLAIANFDVAYQNFGSEVLLWDRSSNRYFDSIPDHHRDQFDF